jgi:hypothetical protein
MAGDSLITANVGSAPVLAGAPNGPILALGLAPFALDQYALLAAAPRAVGVIHGASPMRRFGLTPRLSPETRERVRNIAVLCGI